MEFIEEAVESYERRRFVTEVEDEIDKDTIVRRICNSKLLKIVRSKQRECIEGIESENERFMESIDTNIDSLVGLRVNKIRIDTINKASEDMVEIINRRKNREAKNKIIKALREIADNKTS